MSCKFSVTFQFLLLLVHFYFSNGWETKLNFFENAGHLWRSDGQGSSCCVINPEILVPKPWGRLKFDQTGTRSFWRWWKLSKLLPSGLDKFNICVHWFSCTENDFVCTFVQARLSVHKKVTVGAKFYCLSYNVLIDIIFSIFFGNC